MTIATNQSLRALLSPASVDAFFADYWPNRHFSIHGELGRLPAVFRSRELSCFETLANRYNGPVAFGKGRSGPCTITIQGTHPVDLYRMGLTVYLADIAHCVPGGVEFLRQLERDLGVNEGAARMT